MSHLSTARGRMVRTSCLAALVTTAASLTVVGTSAQADAAVRTSKYLVAAHGYGSRVISGQVGLESAPTAYSVIGCAKATGVASRNKVNATDLNGQVKIGAVTTSQRSLLINGTSISRSITTMASVDLGSDALGLRITGLSGISDARANKAGKFSASNSLTFARIQSRGPVALPAALQQPADVILRTLARRGPITIPGLGTLALGKSSASATSSYGRATGDGLRVHLFGTDQLPGTADDSDVGLTRSYAYISRLAPYGVFGGAAWGIDATALGGITAVGRNPYTPLNCQGTGGKIKSQSLVGLNLLNQNQLVVGAMTNRVYGRQGLPKSGATAWDESRVANVSLGGGALKITGIRALAKVVRTSKNRYYPTSAQSIGSIVANGSTQKIPAPGKAIEIPDVARIEVPRPVRTTRGIQVTALRITLLGGSAASTVVNLGNAKVSVRSR